MPEILYFDQSYRKLVDEVDNLLSSSSKISRKDIFLLAMVLGIENPSTIKKRDSFVRQSYLKPNDVNLIYACAWHHFKDVDKLLDENSVYSIAEQCANTGFKVILRYIEESQHQFIKQIMIDTISKFHD